MPNKYRTPIDVESPQHVATTYEPIRFHAPSASGEFSLWNRSLQTLREKFEVANQRERRLVGALFQESRPAYSLAPNIPTEIPESQGMELQFRIECGLLRECGQLFDEQGEPLTAKRPFVDVNGKPILFSNGNPVALIPGFTRQHRFWSNDEFHHAYFQHAQAAGRILLGLPECLKRLVWRDWPEGFDLPDMASLWTEAVFELAWQGIPGSPLFAKKYAWHGGSRYDLNIFSAIRSMTSKGEGPKLISDPPAAWYSVLDNMLAASVDAIDILMSIPAEQIAETPENVATKPKRNRGRPTVTNPNADRKLHDDFKASGLQYKEFATARGIEEDAVREAVDRHRRRKQPKSPRKK